MIISKSNLQAMEKDSQGLTYKDYSIIREELKKHYYKYKPAHDEAVAEFRRKHI